MIAALRVRWLAWALAAAPQALAAAPVPALEVDPVTEEVPATEDGPETEHEPAEAPSDSVLVKGRRAAAPTAGTAAVDPGEARQVAGVAGDPASAIRALPAVTRAPVGTSGLVVWGAAPSESRILIDGVPVPALFHEGGLRSVLPPALLGALVLTPAAFGPEHGRATGGLLEVETTALGEAPLRAEAQVDAIDGSALVEGRPHPAVSLLLAGRYGWLDALLPAVAPDAQVLVPPTVFRDWAGRVAWEAPGAVTRLLVLGARDTVDRQGLALEPGVVPRAQVSRTWHRFILRHEARQGGAQAWLGLDADRRTETFGSVGTLTVDRATQGGVRLWHREGALHLGLDAEAARHHLQRSGTLGLPRRAGDDAVFGQAPGDGVADDAWILDQISIGAWVRADLQLFSRLDLSPGVRVEPSLQRGNRRLPSAAGGVDTGYDRTDFPVDPRLSAELRLPWGLAMRAAGGRYRQAPEPADTSPVFGSTALDGPVSWHGLGGLRWRGSGGGEVEALGFVRRATGLTVRADAPSPALAAALEATGEARTRGTQLTVRLPRRGGWSGSAGYTLAWSERRAGGAWTPFDEDRRHQLNAVLGYSFDLWRLGARLQLASGPPRPAVVGGVFDAAHGRFDPVFAESPTRLDAAFQLDLDGEYRKEIGDFEYAGYLSVLNVTGRRNAEDRVHRFDYGAAAALTGLPTLAVVGLRLRYR